MLARSSVVVVAACVAVAVAAVKPEESSNLLSHHRQGEARLNSASTSTTTGLITVGSNFATLTVNPQSVLTSLLAGASVAAIGVAVAAAIAIPLGIAGGVFADDDYPDYAVAFRRDGNFADFDLADATSKSSYTSYSPVGRSLEAWAPALRRLHQAYHTYRDEGEVTFTW